ncbi:MAG: hypothetical protein GY754_41345 [bacterium]|nr:hypothetical protein [bacterium]
MKNEKYKDYKRPTLLLTPEQHKRIKLLCVENDIKLQDFLTHAAMYCLEKNILPEE